MEIIITASAAAAQQESARIFRWQLREKPDCVLGLATGSTPIGVYALLVEMYEKQEIDFSRVRTFNLDEYVGLAGDHPGSYRHFMQQHLFGKVNIRPENTHVPDGLAQDVRAHCAAYEEAIRRAGGIDLQLLGLNRDGHIGFNEPTSSLASRTRLKTITPQTAADNVGVFGSPEKVPRHVITMGIGTIMESRRVLMMATGPAKAPVVTRMVEGPITADCPATILQMHPSCMVVLDEDAASQLKRENYYRWVYANKPDWQRM